MRANEDIKMILMRLFVCVKNGKNRINANAQVQAQYTMELALIEIVAIATGGL